MSNTIKESQLSEIIMESVKKILNERNDGMNFMYISENLESMKSEILKFHDYLIGADEENGYNGLYKELYMDSQNPQKAEWLRENEAEYAKMILALGKSMRDMIYNIDDAINEINYLS